jgi:sugar O-acyltransferase (sialic acid O-acetyltransferase NeuD family)
MNDMAFGLFGAGGHAREIMPVFREQLTSMLLLDSSSLYFVDCMPSQSEINGIPCIEEDKFFSLGGTKFFNIAIGDSRLRERIAATAEKYCTPMTIMGTSTYIGDENDIHPSAMFSINSSVTSNVKIGKYFQCNQRSYVSHDCIIGDFVTFAPNVNCLGNVIVKDHVYIGAGAIIRNGSSDNPIVIGEGAVVGMGAVVTKSVPVGKTVVGIPAIELEK